MWECERRIERYDSEVSVSRLWRTSSTPINGNAAAKNLGPDAALNASQLLQRATETRLLGTERFLGSGDLNSIAVIERGKDVVQVDASQHRAQLKVAIGWRGDVEVRAQMKRRLGAERSHSGLDAREEAD